MYARILVECSMTHEFPDFIEFKNDKGVVMQQKILYEWRPVKCDTCHGAGHVFEDCKKLNTKKVHKQWVQKRVVHKDA